jgi:aryl-alcohol dehydrogenase-like predicted oxidoreductase
MDSNSNGDEYQLLQRIVADEEQLRHKREVTKDFESSIALDCERSMLAGHATRDGVGRFIAQFGEGSVDFYRANREISISSLGIGTNLGATNNETDIAYARAVYTALRGGVNLVDTSLNYRHQRSERAVAAGLRAFIQRSGGARDGIVLCSKGGYLVPGAFPVNTIGVGKVEGALHSMAPAFLADQIERSRWNLGVETIDIYYLHNPEAQLEFTEFPVFMRNIRVAFEQLEFAVSNGLIQYYGTSTGGGFRSGALSLRALVEAARLVAGDKHHFRFLQLPFNWKMQEALTRGVDRGANVLDVAAEFELTVIANSTLLQARTLRSLFMEFSKMPPYQYTDAQWAIQFARSTPGISSAMIGMREKTHVVENLAISKMPPLTPNQYRLISLQLLKTLGSQI